MSNDRLRVNDFISEPYIIEMSAWKRQDNDIHFSGHLVRKTKAITANVD